MDDEEKQRATALAEKLLKSGWLEKINTLVLAGMGEVFYSSYYRQLLITDLQRNQVCILSNGILFNEENWQKIANKYKKIGVEISIDAATKETYKKLRGGDFKTLFKNLTMIANLRRQNKIINFAINFVVQRENFHEMITFVRMGIELGVDRVIFQNMFSRYFFNPKEYKNNCLIIKNKYLDYELWKVLQDPIFQNPIVDLRRLQKHLDISEKKYRKRYKRELYAQWKKNKTNNIDSVSVFVQH